MHSSVNITYTYVNGYCLVVRLSSQLLFRIKIIVVSGGVGSSWVDFEMRSETQSDRNIFLDINKFCSEHWTTELYAPIVIDI